MKKINQKDQKTLDRIKHFYETVYYNEVDSNLPSRHDFALAKRIGVTKGQQVLDVACGTGQWLQACNQLNAIPSGVDLSEKAISACRNKLPEGEFYAQSAESLPFGDGRFDIVTCLGSLEHFVHPEKALIEMRRVAKDDGLFIILVPNADFLTRKLGLYKGTNQTDAREVVRSLEEWNKLFEDSGLFVFERWKDLHTLSWSWIKAAHWLKIPVRALQAVALPIWPLRWQYQVFHACKKSKSREN